MRKSLSPVIEFAVTSFEKKGTPAPPLTPWGFFLPADHGPDFALLMASD